MTFILRTPDHSLHLAPGGVLMPPAESAPLLFHTEQAAYRIAQTQPDYDGLVVDMVADNG